MSRVNIKDVAERAGVSTATVSHVLNETRYVREETRQRVLLAVQELNYHPSSIARGLATNSTQTIGLVVSDITNPFFTAMAKAIEDVVTNHHGYYTIFCNTDEDPEREEEYLRLLQARQIDGLIITPTGVHSERLIQINRLGIPILLLDRSAPEVDAPLLEVDNEDGAYQATCYLIELGHRRIAVLTGKNMISTLHKRLKGYKRALDEADIPFDETLIVRSDPKFYGITPQTDGTILYPLVDEQIASSPCAALRDVLNSPDPPTAIFVTNNQMTLRALYALKEVGLRCPNDVSVISFDDHDWAPLFSPPLTVIRQPTHQLGQTAAQVLMQLINKEAIDEIPRMPVELIIRESCRPVTPTIH